jgi:hypothetical protein
VDLTTRGMEEQNNRNILLSCNNKELVDVIVHFSSSFIIASEVFFFGMYVQVKSTKIE